MTAKARDADHRSHPRVTAEHAIRLVVALHGFDEAERRFEARGVTVNLSHRGALVRVDRPVAPGSRCLVHLPESESLVGRSMIYGTVLRMREREGSFEIAIQFDTRLQTIALDDSLEGA